MSKKAGDLQPGDTVNVGGEKMKVTDVRKDDSGERVAVSMEGKGSSAQHSGGADDRVGD